MRFPRAALIFLVSGFVFFSMYAVSNLLMTEFSDAVAPFDSGYDSTYQDLKSSLPDAFGLISVIMFVMVIIVFILDSLGEEYEYYPRRRQ